MVAITNFIKDNWTEFKKKGPWGYFWEKNIEHSAPSKPYEDCAYVALMYYNEKTKEFDDVGIWIYDRHAKAHTAKGSLKEQIEYRKWYDQQIKNGLPTTASHLKKDNPDLCEKLYYPDGRKKSPLDLSIINPTKHKKDAVRETVLNDVKFHRDNKDESYRVPLFALFKSKLRIKEEFFPNNLCAEEYAKHIQDGTLPPDTPKLVLKESPSSVPVIYNNPHDKVPTREKLLHAAGPWIAWLITLSMCAAAWAAPTLVHSIVFAFAAWTVHRSNNYGDMFSKAKTLNRDLDWLTSKEFSWIGKFDKWNTLKSIGKGLALLIAMQQAATAAYTGTMSIGLLAASPSLQVGAALFFGAVAFIGAYVSFFDSMRYQLGFTLSDNSISPSDFDDLVVNRNKDTAPLHRTSSLKPVRLIDRFEKVANQKPDANNTIRTEISADNISSPIPKLG